MINDKKTTYEVEMDKLYAAQEQGYKFIEIVLSKKRVPGLKPEISIHGVKKLIAYSKGMNDEGIQEFEFVKSSGTIQFFRNREKRAYIGYMWHDDNEGLYGEKSYNIDFLATHMETGDFKIVEAKYRKLVEDRLVIIKKILSEREETPVSTEQEKIEPGMATEAIDDKIAFLQKQKEKILAAEGSTKKPKSKTTEKTPAKPTEKKTTTRRSATRRNTRSVASKDNPSNEVQSIRTADNTLQGV